MFHNNYIIDEEATSNLFNSSMLFCYATIKGVK